MRESGLHEALPPRSQVRLICTDSQTPRWAQSVGREFRIGYYSRNDRLDVIGLDNDQGDFDQTIDHECLVSYFDVLQRSEETDIFGEHRAPLEAVTTINPS